MEQMINISGRETGFRASALTPKLYRTQTGRDLLLDMQRMTRAIQGNGGSMETLAMLDDFAYCLARQYAKAHGQEIEDTADEWLDQFELLDVYSIYPDLVQLWATSSRTTSTAKKNSPRQ